MPRVLRNNRPARSAPPVPSPAAVSSSATTSPLTRAGTRAGTLAAIAAAGLTLAACSSSSPSGSATSGSSSTTLSVSGSAASASQIAGLSTAVKNAEKASFSATYTVTENGSTAQTVTIEQQSPKSAFVTSASSYINTGTTAYYCSKPTTPGGAETCLAASGARNPLAGLITLFSPDTAVSAMESAQAEIGAHLVGYKVSISAATYAGLPSKCADITAAGKSAKYCVTDSGILAYEGSGASSFELTMYSSSVSASDFTLPPGATVETIPTS